MEVFEISLGEGCTIKLAELTWGASDRFVKSGKELQAKAEGATPDEWLNRMAQMVCDSLTKANGRAHGEYTIEGPEGLKENFSIRDIRMMHDAILEHSGLKVRELGEAAATPIHRGSDSAVA